MFRWTAGTKARADRAARLHSISGGPGQLLLASRPLPTALQLDKNSAALFGQVQAAVAAVPPTPVPSPAPTRDESVPPACERVNCETDTHEATQSPEKKGAVSSDADAFTEAAVPAPAVHDSTTRTARAASVPSAVSVDLLSCASAVGPTDTTVVVHPSASAAKPPSSLQAATNFVPRLPPSRGCTVLSPPPAPCVSLRHADQLVRAAAPAAAGTAAVAQHRAKRHRDHDRQRHHRHDRNQNGSCNDHARHEVEQCTNRGGGKARGDLWSTANSSDTPRSCLSDGMRNTYGLVQQRLLHDHRYSNSEHSSRGQARHRRCSPQHGQAAARPSPPPQPVPRPVVSVDCVLVQQPLHGPSSQAPSTATSSTVSYRPGYQSGQQAYGVSRDTTRAHSSVAAAAPTTGGAVPDAYQSHPPSFSSPRWGEEEATSTVSQDATMVTVVADAYRDEVAQTSPPLPVDATLFQEPEASHGFPFASPARWEGRAEDGWRRPARTAQTSLQPLPHQPYPSLTNVDVEDRPFAWSSSQPSSLFDDPFSRREESGADSGMWLLSPSLPLARSTKEEEGERAWAADSSFAVPPRGGGNALFPSVEAAWRPPRLPLPPAGESSTAAAAPWQRSGQWEEEPDNAALTNAAGALFPHAHDFPCAHDASFSFPWSAPPPVDARRRGEGGWTEQTSAAEPVFPSQRTAHLPSLQHEREMRLHPPWEPLPCGPPHQQMSAAQPLPHTMRRAPEVGTHTAAAMQRGGGEGIQRGRRRQRQPPAHALNGTTERCRRFWERCRHAPDINPPRSSGFY